MAKRRLDDDEDDFMEDEEESEEEGDGPSGLALGHHLEDAYVGDARFETVELAVPGTSEGEDFRVSFIIDDSTRFLVSVLGDDGFARVGFSTNSEALSEKIEQGILDSGLSMTEFLEEAIGDSDGVENEMQHFHDDAYYFCSDIPYDGPQQLSSRAFREEITRYLDGYFDALLEFLGDEDED